MHRLDRDCSGLLVLARTQTAATVLHSIFREKTCGASAYVHPLLSLRSPPCLSWFVGNTHKFLSSNDFSFILQGVKKNIKSLKRKYMALVIGCPRRQKGQISAPLRKVSLHSVGENAGFFRFKKCRVVSFVQIQSIAFAALLESNSKLNYMWNVWVGGCGWWKIWSYHC